MKTYYGTKRSGGRDVTVIDDGGGRPLRHVNRHSPDGFEWGYSGSGPADLALSILADHLAEDPIGRSQWAPPLECELRYQHFKVDYVSAWGPTWEITGDEIECWLELERQKAPLN